MNTKSHYENHLAQYYTWISGDREEKVRAMQVFFTTRSIKPEAAQIAIDLGCGTGIQTSALAALGFQVIGIDFSSQLLNELRQYTDSSSITLLETDILDFPAYSQYQPELIVCMGDTLTHLPNLEAVQNLTSNSYRLLCQNGKIVFAFRNYSSPLEDEKRFIPVRSDENTIFTCFLEYLDSQVKVFDIVHKKQDNIWTQSISHYTKCVISPADINRIVSSAGFRLVEIETKNGLITVVARK